MEKAASIGIGAYKAELDKKTHLLKRLLADYDDGRRKSFYCTAVNLLDFQDVRSVMDQVEAIGMDTDLKNKAKAAAAAFEEMAAKRGISLKLRR